MTSKFANKPNYELFELPELCANVLAAVEYDECGETIRLELRQLREGERYAWTYDAGNDSAGICEEEFPTMRAALVHMAGVIVDSRPQK